MSRREGAGAEAGTRARSRRRAAPGRRRLLSPLTRRILTVNVLALGLLVAGLLYLGQYESSLIDAELGALRTQAEIFAGALGEGAAATRPDGGQRLKPEVARTMLRRLVEPTHSRARLFTAEDGLIADSRRLAGPGGAVEIQALPAPSESVPLFEAAVRLYEKVTSVLSHRSELMPYREYPRQRVADYPEVVRALAGEADSVVRSDGGTGMVLSVAVPVQRFKKVLGALMLTTDSGRIDAALREVRLGILKVFGVALGITVLLSLYLAGTIARPVRRLAAAAERVRHGHGRSATIPDFTRREDEIGDLSAALREMTESLWQRMEAIERFAADVAHELKNPLTSLRSAVETAARVSDPEQQRKLMSIIQEDVQRLDRLISDISDASRLDAELARGDTGRLDIGRLLDALVQVHASTAAEGRPRLSLSLGGETPLLVEGNEGRLVQVFQNLITNAFSFSPPQGEVRIHADRDGRFVRIMIDDDGPGIPEENLETIFERFYTERPEGERFGTHSGLGLSISRQIVAAHNGAIVAVNRKDPEGRVQGARFTVWLPAA